MLPFRTFSARHIGGIRLGALFLALGIFSLLFSGRGLLRAINNRQPVLINCDAPPNTTLDNRWVQLTNCQLDLPSAAFSSNAPTLRPSELFVPLRALDNSTGKVYIVLRTSHPIFIATFLQMQRFKSSDDAAVWVSRNREMAFPIRAVTGIARIERNASRPDLVALRNAIAAEFILVNENERPRFGQHGWLFAIGLGLLILGGSAFLKAKAAGH